MIVGIILGAIGCLVAIFALKCLKMGNMEDNIKATMTLAAGILNLLAGSFWPLGHHLVLIIIIKIQKNIVDVCKYKECISTQEDKQCGLGFGSA